MDQPDMVRKVKGPFSDKLGRKWACACGREHFLPTRWVDVGYGALERIPEQLSREGWRGEVLLVADEATYEAAGRRVALVLREGRFGVKELVFPLPLKATEEVATHLLGRVGGEAGLVAVGSGTVNDIVKWAAHRAGRPYIVVPTAASMNGYTSPDEGGQAHHPLLPARGRILRPRGGDLGPGGYGPRWVRGPPIQGGGRPGLVDFGTALRGALLSPPEGGRGVLGGGA